MARRKTHAVQAVDSTGQHGHSAKRAADLHRCRDAGVTEASVFEDVTPNLPAAVLDALPDEEAKRRVFQEVSMLAVVGRTPRSHEDDA